jgi:hypothetical protein
VTRSTRRMPRAAALVPASAVTAALLLSGCGGPAVSGAAAVVGDRRITESDLQVATRDLQKVVGPENPLTQPQVLSYMVVGPIALDVAAKNGIGVSQDDAVKVLAGKVTDPSEPTLLAARGAIALSQLSRGLEQAASQQAYQDVLAQVKATSITVNPRYGVFDGERFAINPVSPNWLVPKAAPTQVPADGTNPDGTPQDGSQPAPTNS